MNKTNNLLKHILFFGILFYCTFYYGTALAQDYNIKESYKMLEYYCYKLGNEDTAYKYHDKLVDVMNYAVEILKKAPESYQAAGVTATYMLPFDNISYDAQKIYDKFYDKYMNEFENTDVNIETAEKLFFIMTHLGHVMFSNKENEADGDKNWKKCKDVLKKMKDECNNKNFIALSTLVLARVERKIDYLYEFLEKYPTHPIIPNVKLSIITEKYDLSIDIEKYKNEVEKLMSQYKDFVDVSGYTFDINCYEALAGAYLRLNDKETAQKYIDIIKARTPQNPMLKEFKEMMNSKTWEEAQKEMMKK